MKKSLYQLSAEALEIESVLEENGGELTPELEEALVLNETQMAEKADNITGLIRKFQAMEDACKAEKKRITDLQSTAHKSAERLKNMVLTNMGTFGYDKIEGSTCKMSRRRSEKTEANEDMLLAGYQAQINELRRSLPVWAKVEVKVSLTELKNQIKMDGVIPEGAEIVENYTLQIK